MNQENQEKKFKHLTLDDRIEIQECLCKQMSFKAIGNRIGKDQTTVSKEVKLHGQTYTNSFTKTDECCPKLLKAPFVCNGCPNKSSRSCIYARRVYSAQKAQKDYETVLVESREGIPLTKQKFYDTEEVVSNAVKNGQNVYHAITANNLDVSKSSVYRYISNGYYSISKVDLPRAAKFKPRKASKGEYVPKGVKIGRSFNDFMAYLEEHPNTNYVEMDTVIGRIGGKLIMTFQFVNVDFMFGLLIDNKTAAEASSKILLLKERLDCAGLRFSEIFPVLLTDNGGEFSNVAAFENDSSGHQSTRMFFCDPNSPYQKPHVENNHTLFRGIVGTGSSFDAFSQNDVDLIFSHINSVKRKQFNGKSAYEMFSFAYSEELAAALGISYVDPKDVIQTPKLLKHVLNK